MKKAFAVIVCIVVIIMVVVFTRVSHTPTETAEMPTTDASSQTQGEAQSTDTSLNTQTPNGTDTQTTMEPTTKTTKMANGLEITVLAEGTGEAAKAGDKVSVNYTGALTNGTVFDSNVDSKFGHVEPFTFTLGAGMVIKGWDQGVLGMKVGEKRRLVIPSELGYGARGAGASIPPNATLAFDVEVTGINK